MLAAAVSHDSDEIGSRRLADDYACNATMMHCD
jgi:hypothetical protein